MSVSSPSKGKNGNSVSQAARRVLRLSHPSHVSVLARDLLGWAHVPQDARTHLDQTMAWLARAQEQGGGAGVSAGYSLLDGWLPPYPETTGYIIPTFYDYAQLSGHDEFRSRARRMADWEIEVQLPSGAVRAGLYRSSTAGTPAVFNTGQVMLGWHRAFTETGDARYLAAATRAANWLVAVQQPTGAWSMNSSEVETTLHAYDVRTAWSLLQLSRLVNNPSYADSAQRNLEWTLAQQHSNGWFDNNAFFISSKKWNRPLTHTIAYVMEGLFETSQILGEMRLLEAARKTADRLLQIFDDRGWVPGEFDCSWNSRAAYRCLTGDAQLAGMWLRLFAHTGDMRYFRAAKKLNADVMGTQDLHCANPGIRGGVKGSQPIAGRYTPFTYINWGAKFLADSLMLQEQLVKDGRSEELRMSLTEGNTTACA